jgi:hypothetical protein
MTVTSDPLSTVLPPPTPLSSEDWRTLQQCKSAYHYARSAKKNLYANWKRNWLLLNNRMWSDFRLAWMPSPSDSEIYPILANLIAWGTDQSVMFTVQAASVPNTPWAQTLEDVADDLELVLQSNWKVRNQQGTVTLCMWDAALFGAGIFKAVWDQSLDSGEGDADFVRVDPWNFYPDPQARDEMDGEFYCEIRRMSWDEVERRFPDACDNLLSDIVYDVSEGGLDSDDRPTNVRTGPAQFPFSQSQGFQGTFSGGGTTNPQTSATGMPGQSRVKAMARPEGVIVYEMWRRRNRTTQVADPKFEAPESDPTQQAPDVDVTYDDWQVVVWSSNTILLKAWASDLWEGATHPYARFVLEDTGEFWPTPLVSHLAPAQIAINRLLASLQQSAELTGNPIFVESSTGRTANSLAVNRPGQRLRVDPASLAQGGPHWLNPPTMSADVLGLIRFWIERMENISGLTTTNKGKAPQPRTPEAVVSQVQESGFVRIRGMLRNLERTLRRIGSIEAQLIVENYTRSRILSVMGPEGERSVVMLRERHFLEATENQLAPFRYSLSVNAGSDVPTSRQSRVSEAINLFTLKLIDRPAALEMCQVAHWPAIEQRMEQKEQQAAQAAAQEEATMRQRTGRKT